MRHVPFNILLKYEFTLLEFIILWDINNASIERVNSDILKQHWLHEILQNLGKWLAGFRQPDKMYLDFTPMSEEESSCA